MPNYTKPTPRGSRQMPEMPRISQTVARLLLTGIKTIFKGGKINYFNFIQTYAISITQCKYNEEGDFYELRDFKK